MAILPQLLKPFLPDGDTVHSGGKEEKSGKSGQHLIPMPFLDKEAPQFPMCGQPEIQTTLSGRTVIKPNRLNLRQEKEKILLWLKRRHICIALEKSEMLTFRVK